MSSPKVSVIIPLYNAHEYIRACLDSVLAQTLQDLEVLCVDDGSTDDSYAILQEYAAKDSRVRVYTKENGGAGAARNFALPLVTGEYLSILDADDFFEPTMLEKSYREASERAADVVVFGCDFYDNESDTYRSCNYSIRHSLLPGNNPFNAREVKEDVFKLFVGWAWDKLFRTEFVRQNNLFFQEQRTTNDMLFVFRGLIHADSIYVLDEVLAHHRRGVESLSVTREKSWMCFYNALIALRDDLKTSGCYERFERDYKNYCVHFCLWNLDTLKEPTHTLLYNKLREEWFEELGLLEHPREYFYNQHEYRKFRNVYETPCGQSVAVKKVALTKWEKIRRYVKKLFSTVQTKGIKYTCKLVKEKLVKK